jgi:hypothetical protein
MVDGSGQTLKVVALILCKSAKYLVGQWRTWRGRKIVPQLGADLPVHVLFKRGRWMAMKEVGE